MRLEIISAGSIAVAINSAEPVPRTTVTKKPRAVFVPAWFVEVVSAPEAASLSEEGARADQKAGWPPQCRHVVGCRARKPNSHDLGIGIGLLVGGWVLLIPAILILLQAAVAALIAANTATGE